MMALRPASLLWIFLSTPSARRATCGRTKTHDRKTISIHALREEGDPNNHQCQTGHQISIHALREEGDFKHRRRSRDRP